VITALLLRLGVPRWVAITALCILAATGALAYRAHLINLGISIEAVRRDALDAEAARLARAALAEINGRLAAAQAQLAEALARVDKLKSDLDNEKATSTALQSDLSAGRRRMSVAIAGVCRPAQAEHAEGAAAAGVDQGGEPATADLDPRVASDLEWARSTRNEAIIAAQACIAAYDAVSAAASAAE
jgi:hypothetical protein